MDSSPWGSRASPPHSRTRREMGVQAGHRVSSSSCCVEIERVEVRRTWGHLEDPAGQAHRSLRPGRACTWVTEEKGRGFRYSRRAEGRANAETEVTEPQSSGWLGLWSLLGLRPAPPCGGPDAVQGPPDPRQALADALGSLQPEPPHPPTSCDPSSITCLDRPQQTLSALPAS